MYERWQHNLFPSLGFDDFLAEVEKIGRTAEVKVGHMPMQIPSLLQS